MNSIAAYLRYTWFVLIMVFLVILAGGVVRMTQSGMGCPDWPTCFGRWIPPTHASQLPPDFEKYLRQQDIDHSFNPYHTWIEYINRLLGVILGIVIFIHTIWSFRKFRKERPGIFYTSLFMLLAVAFQGWLGKRVVDSNLEALKITTHMIVALLIAALPIVIIYKIRDRRTPASKSMKSLVMIALFLVLIQIVLGTQVREQIDIISRSLKYEQRELWLGRVDDLFLVHRSFSWIVAAACIFLFWQTQDIRSMRRQARYVLLLMLGSVVAGVVMYFMDIPAWAQPLHLMMASMLALSLFAFRLQMK